MSPDPPNQADWRPDNPDFQTALALSEGLPLTAANLERVASRSSARAARAAFGQWALRARAGAKFPQAERMLFVAEALEQASGELASQYHASLFPEGAVVVDTTCGIGGDLTALARRGPAVGLELDPHRAELARFNLAALDLGGEVLAEDAVEFLATHSPRYVFCDPARRADGRRLRGADEYRPNPHEVAKLCQRCDLYAIKLSPMLPDEVLCSLGVRVEFVSADGEGKEALALGGHDAAPGIFAVHAETRSVLTGGTPNAPVGELREFVYDADPAAARSHALGTLCEQLALFGLGESLGYLTSEILVESPWLKSYRVLEEGAGDVKRTKQRLAALGAATPVVKQRRCGLDLVKLRKEWRREGSRRVVVICYPREGRVRHLIAEAIL